MKGGIISSGLPALRCRADLNLLASLVLHLPSGSMQPTGASLRPESRGVSLSESWLSCSTSNSGRAWAVERALVPVQGDGSPLSSSKTIPGPGMPVPRATRLPAGSTTPHRFSRRYVQGKERGEGEEVVMEGKGKTSLSHPQNRHPCSCDSGEKQTCSVAVSSYWPGR